MRRCGGPWDEILKSPLLWHFRFGGPDMERLVASRKRIHLDRFWNEFSADPAHFPEAALGNEHHMVFAVPLAVAQARVIVHRETPSRVRGGSGAESFIDGRLP